MGGDIVEKDAGVDTAIGHRPTHRRTEAPVARRVHHGNTHRATKEVLPSLSQIDRRIKEHHKCDQADQNTGKCKLDQNRRKLDATPPPHTHPRAHTRLGDGKGDGAVNGVHANRRQVAVRASTGGPPLDKASGANAWGSNHAEPQRRAIYRIERDCEQNGKAEGVRRESRKL